MQIVKPVLDREFCCLAGACPDTCCAMWQIPVDEGSVERWKSLPAPWAETMRESMEVVDGEWQLKRHEGQCVLLREDGLCRFYEACGPENLCRNCFLHPRFVAEYGGVREIMPGLSCPAWAKLYLLQSEPTVFETEETDELPAWNDLDGLLFYRLKKARQQALALLQNRAKPLEDRMEEVLTLAEEFDGEQEESAAGGDSRRVWRQKLLKMEILMPQWRNYLERSLHGQKNEKWETIGEQVLVYYTFRLFYQTVYTGRLLPWVKQIVWSWLVLRNIGFNCADEAEFCEVIRLFSKETEHSAENMDALHRAFCRRSGHYSTAALRREMKKKSEKEAEQIC